MGIEQGDQATDEVIIFSRGFRGGAMLVRSEWVMEMMRATPGPWTQLEFVVVGDQLPFGIAALVDLFVSEVGALVGGSRGAYVSASSARTSFSVPVSESRASPM
jgi:hypothetical protein